MSPRAPLIAGGSQPDPAMQGSLAPVRSEASWASPDWGRASSARDRAAGMAAVWGLVARPSRCPHSSCTRPGRNRWCQLTGNGSSLRGARPCAPRAPLIAGGSQLDPAMQGSLAPACGQPRGLRMAGADEDDYWEADSVRPRLRGGRVVACLLESSNSAVAILSTSHSTLTSGLHNAEARNFAEMTNPDSHQSQA